MLFSRAVNLAGICLLSVLLGFGWRQPERGFVSPAPIGGVRIQTSPGGLQSDSVNLVITNSMPHPMTLEYENSKRRRPLGVVDANVEKTFTIRDLYGDSVTVWATHDDPPHNLKQTFPTHSPTPLTWTLEPPLGS
jgi:hypothetical protein